ncbi:aspartate-semialdehyde dehydrogenase [Vagococcus sp.]|uniref:aspartate-semialdehyde dehydrogenase n=1 Tax=Vagococcus sp. TaxID=1933889 RepID=UPI003F98AE5E
MKKYHIAILGVTGAVGQEMLKVLSERQLPIKKLHVFASKRSAGQTLHFENQDLTIEELTGDCFKGIDIVLSALDDEIARQFLPKAVAAGCLVIDNSSIYRLNEAVPLIVPEINAEDIKKNQGIIANPNCSTIIGLVAIAPLHQRYSIQQIVVSTYQAVSGAGIAGTHELEQQIKELENQDAPTIDAFQYQIAYNLIPQIGGFDAEGNTSEELKFQNEGRKILHHPNLNVICTCVRVPVIRSHSESITLYFDEDFSIEEVKKLLSVAPGVKLIDETDDIPYPMPLEASGQDLVYVGRIRKQKINQQTVISLWCCGDQLRKGAATNAIQIAQSYIEQN